MDAMNEQLNDEGREMWNKKAAFWDNLHGDAGNRFHRELISPAVESLLALQAGEKVLDIACGSGMLARRLAALGAQVTATDFSANLIEIAHERKQTAGEPIDYRVVDATDEEALVALGTGQYDAITCTMALMDMPLIEPLFRAVKQLLKSDGRFVFATSHPAFNSNNPVFVSEQADRDGELITSHALKINRYLDVPPARAVGAPGEPSAHYYYHRPLHELLGAGFAAGLVLDGLEEPGFDPHGADSERPLSWYSVWQIPPVLAGRMRLGR